jgi:hypothetical protein
MSAKSVISTGLIPTRWCAGFEDYRPLPHVGLLDDRFPLKTISADAIAVKICSMDKRARDNGNIRCPGIDACYLGDATGGAFAVHPT